MNLPEWCAMEQHLKQKSSINSAELARLEQLIGYLNQDPNNVLLRADIFALALALGRWDVAQEQVAHALSDAPMDLAWRHRLALLDIAQQNLDEAEILLKNMQREGVSDPAIAYNIAYIDFMRGRYAEAITLLDTLLPYHLSSIPEILTLNLRCRHRTRAIREAIAIFEQYAEEGASAQAFGVASLLAVDANGLSKAWQWANQALQEDSGQHEALVARGSCLLAQRDVQGALQSLLVARQLHSQDGRTLSALGMAYLLAMDLPAAHSALTSAVRSMPDHIGSWHGLGWCNIFRRDFPNAQKAFEQALLLDRNFAESHGGIAVALALQGQDGRAQEAIDHAIRLDRRCVAARYAEAILKGEANNPDKFMRLARQVLGQHQDDTGRSLADVVLGQPVH